MGPRSRQGVVRQPLLLLASCLPTAAPFATLPRARFFAATGNSRGELQPTVLAAGCDGDGECVDGSSAWVHLPENRRLDGAPMSEELGALVGSCDAIVASFDVDSDQIHEMWARPCHARCEGELERTLPHQRADEQHSMPAVPKEAIKAINATHRWSTNFVRQLQLCPWAGASLDTPGAIRYWVLTVDGAHADPERRWTAALDEMEKLVRRAGRQLERITSPSAEEDVAPIDNSVAISFVVLVDRARGGRLLPDFGTFHEFFLDLEDRLLDECDEYWDVIDENDDKAMEDAPLGCEITIAAFHPQWKFGWDGGNAEIDQAIDYEKRTPYPTISIVMSSAIDALMSQDGSADVGVETSSDGALDASSAPATVRIAALNERTLEGIGTERLKEIFEGAVVQCPMNHGEQN